MKSRSYACGVHCLPHRAKNSTGRAGTIRLDQRKPAGTPRPNETVDTIEEEIPDISPDDVAFTPTASGGKESKRRRCAGMRHSSCLALATSVFNGRACGLRINLSTHQFVNIGKKLRPRQQVQVAAAYQRSFRHAIHHAMKSFSLALMIQIAMGSAKRAFVFGVTPIRTIIGVPSKKQ